MIISPDMWLCLAKSLYNCHVKHSSAKQLSNLTKGSALDRRWAHDCTTRRSQSFFFLLSISVFKSSEGGWDICTSTITSSIGNEDSIYSHGAGRHILAYLRLVAPIGLTNQRFQTWVTGFLVTKIMFLSSSVVIVHLDNCWKNTPRYNLLSKPLKGRTISNWVQGRC